MTTMSAAKTKAVGICSGFFDATAKLDSADRVAPRRHS